MYVCSCCCHLTSMLRAFCTAPHIHSLVVNHDALRAQTKDADATSASGEGEDWDKEFGIETEEDSTSLFANLRATAVRASIDRSIDLTLSHSSHDT